MVWKSQRTHCAWCGEPWTRRHQCPVFWQIAAKLGPIERGEKILAADLRVDDE